MLDKTRSSKYSAEERKVIMSRCVNADGRLLPNVMAHECGVSEDSIRRDLPDFAESVLIQRCYGGAAKLVASPVEFQRRRTLDNAEKELVAAVVIPLIHDDATLLLDSSTTVLEFVHEVPPGMRLRIFTSAVDIVAAALDHPGIDVIVLGGRFNRHTRRAVDARALDGIRAIRADFCILGACGIDDALNVWADDFEDAYIKGAMMKAARQTLLLTTSGRLGTTCVHLVASISAVSVVVTDRVDLAFADRVHETGVNVYFAL